jgi:hypothetical protein
MHGGVGGGGREANPYPDKHPGSGIGSASRDFERAPQRRNIEVSTRHGQIECDEPSRSDAIRPPADRGWKQGTAWKLPLGATCERWPRRSVCSSESIGPIPGLELTGQARFPRLARLKIVVAAPTMRHCVVIAGIGGRATRHPHLFRARCRRSRRAADTGALHRR